MAECALRDERDPMRLDANDDAEALEARSKAGLAWLREYMSTPDDMGKDWWDEFRRDLVNKCQVWYVFR